MSQLSLLNESADTLAHATLAIGYSEGDQATLLERLNVPVGDRVEVSAVENGGIKDIHEFASKVLLSPQFGPVRLGIIKEAQALTPQAQNALLKLLEEPPTRTKIILFSSSDAAILQTIRSRCRVYYGVKTTELTGSKAFKGDILSQFMAAETLAKEEDLEAVLLNELTQAYTDWQKRGYTAAEAKRLEKLLELYNNVSSNTNKRLLLEQFVVDSL